MQPHQHHAERACRCIPCTLLDLQVGLPPLAASGGDAAAVDQQPSSPHPQSMHAHAQKGTPPRPEDNMRQGPKGRRFPSPMLVGKNGEFRARTCVQLYVLHAPASTARVSNMAYVPDG